MSGLDAVSRNGLIYTGIFQHDQPRGRCKWEVARKGLAQHGEIARIEGELELEEEAKEEIEEEELDESQEPEEERPEKVKTLWISDVELSRDFDKLSTAPSWFLMPVYE
jgi:hypothetical protein